MPIAFTLIESSPHKLRYLAEQDGEIHEEPDDGFNTISNNLSPSPDLGTDIQGVGSEPGVSGIPLKAPIDAARSGYPPLPLGPLTQAQARALFLLDDPTNAVLTNELIGRSLVTIMPREAGGEVNWAVDMNVDIDGNPVVEVRSNLGNAGSAIIDLEFLHSVDR
jgi:hypothetical protein